MGILNWENMKPVLLATLGIVVLCVEPAFAQDLSPITNMLTNVGNALTGPLGGAAGLIALCAVGFMFMTGRMNWVFAGSVLLGLVILYGAATILAALSN